MRLIKKDVSEILEVKKIFISKDHKIIACVFEDVIEILYEGISREDCINKIKDIIKNRIY